MREETPLLYTFWGMHVCAEPNLSGRKSGQTTETERTSIRLPPNVKSASGRYETEGVLMGQSFQVEQEELVASLKALFTDECLRAEKERVCSRCGAVMQHMDVTFWLYESESAWSVRLPVCGCEETSTSPIPTLKRGAA